MKSCKVLFSIGALLVPTLPLRADTLTSGTTSGDRHQEYNIFDVNVLNDVTITGFQQNFIDAATYTYEVWYKEGSASGFVPTSSVWKKFGTSSNFDISAAERLSLTTVNFDSDISLDLGSGKTFGFLVGGDPNHNDLASEVRSGTTRQTSENGAVIGDVIASDSNLEITEGSHGSTDDGIDDPLKPYYYYNWNGALIYNASPTIDSNAVKPYGSMQTVAIDSVDQQRENILALAGKCNSSGISLIEEKLCAFSTISNRYEEIDGTYGFNVHNLNSSFGLEYSFDKSLKAGVAYGYGTANLSDYSLSKISASIESNYSLYSGYLVKKYSDNFSLKSFVGLADFNYGAKRYKNHTYANSKYSSDMFTSAIEGVWNIKSEKYIFNPKIGIVFTNNSQDAFTETGTTHLFTVDANNSNSYLLKSGISLTRAKASQNSNQWIPRLDLNYQYDLAAENKENLGVKAKLTNSSESSSRHQASKYGAHSLNVNLGMDKSLKENVFISANTSYSISNKAKGYSYGAFLKFVF